MCCASSILRVGEAWYGESAISPLGFVIVLTRCLLRGLVWRVERAETEIPPWDWLARSSAVCQ